MKPGGISSRWCVISTIGGRVRSRAQSVEVAHQLFPAADVEAGRRFRRTGRRPVRSSASREQHPLAFAGGESRELVVGDVLATEPFEQVDARGHDPRPCTGATTVRARRNARSSRLRARSCSVLGGRERGGRERDAFAQRAHVAATETLAEHVDGAASSGVGTARRCAAVSSCPRRWAAEDDPPSSSRRPPS